MTAARKDGAIRRTPCAPNGVLVVDKPASLTSHDIVRQVRRALGIREVGHAGTLDPMATGILVLAVGEATKLVPWLTAHDKSYEATLALGVQTDSLDAHGAVDARSPLKGELLAGLAATRSGTVDKAIARALEAERARTTQAPPIYSALRVAGERAFTRARRGEDVLLAPRSVRVMRLVCTGCEVDPPALHLAMDVGKGYYVRALARDLASELGTVGHLTRLVRVKSGPFVAGEAWPSDAPEEALRGAIIPLAQAAARALPAVTVSGPGVESARCGRRVSEKDFTGAARGVTAWIDEQGALVAVGDIAASGEGRVLRGFSG